MSASSRNVRLRGIDQLGQVTEMLSQRHGCRVSRETLRQWMIAEGLWLDRRRRLPSVHQPRNRRARVGELVQIDGSQHFWFENRGPECTLIAYVDDATSRLLHAAFVPSESTFDYLRETKAYVARFGRPIAFYSDKHAVFRVRDAAGRDRHDRGGERLPAGLHRQLQRALRQSALGSG